jgi:phage shock protein PspC (stress-responsive transcriptional regulator)
MVCQQCHQQGINGGQFCSGCGQSFANVQAQPRLMRPRYGRVFAGVCAGFAERYGWDPIIVRLALCAVVLFGCGSPVLLYLVAWMVIPNGPQVWSVPPSAPVAPSGTQAA